VTENDLVAQEELTTNAGLAAALRGLADALPLVLGDATADDAVKVCNMAAGALGRDAGEAERKWRDYENEFILPTFDWAAKEGIDLRALVKANAGKNCVRLLVEALLAQRDAARLRLLSAAGDDLCRLTQEEIKELSSGAVKIPPREEFIASCELFHDQIAAGPGVLTNCLTLAQLIAENEKLRQERDKALAFKTWTHSYCDAHGVPHSPPGTHGAAGCRIGDRLDWLMERLRRVEEACKDALESEEGRDRPDALTIETLKAALAR
jgi:hypothetical protein